jgi:hypothetical protein
MQKKNSFANTCRYYVSVRFKGGKCYLGVIQYCVHRLSHMLPWKRFQCITFLKMLYILHYIQAEILTRVTVNETVNMTNVSLLLRHRSYIKLS